MRTVPVVFQGISNELSILIEESCWLRFNDFSVYKFALSALKSFDHSIRGHALLPLNP